MPLGIVTDDEFARELANSADGRSPSDNVPGGNTVLEVDDENLAPDADSLAIESNGTVEELRRGRGNGNLATPLALQQLIGNSAISSRKESVELASLLGLSPSSASAYANGATSTASYNKPKPELFDFLTQRKGKIAKRAGIKLLHALDGITEDKLEGANVVQLSMVAKNMSGIIKDMEPERAPINPQGNTFNGPSIVMFAPPLVDESRFEHLQVTE